MKRVVFTLCLWDLMNKTKQFLAIPAILLFFLSAVLPQIDYSINIFTFKERIQKALQILLTSK